MKYELINLNLGVNPKAREFSVGHYRIKLVDEYDALRPELSEMMALKHDVTYIGGQKITRTTEIPAKPGKPLITATVECDKESKSFFYENEPESIGDLCLIFSFLTGRRVFLPGEERHNVINHHGFMVVPYYQVPEAAAVAWSNRQNFSTESERLPLWYFLAMNDTPVQQITLILGCVALEIVQNLKENKIESPKSPELQELIKAIQVQISQSQIDKDLKNRLKSTVGKWGGGDPQQAFKNLLINYGLIEANISGIPLKRVAGINGMRNDVVHKGTLRPPDWVEDANAKRNASAYIYGWFIPALLLEPVMNYAASPCSGWTYRRRRREPSLPQVQP